MEKQIYSGHGVVVLEIDGKLKVSWLTGITNEPVYFDISEENFEKLKRSDKDAYEVCIYCETGKWPPSEDEKREATKDFLRKFPKLLIEIPTNQSYFDEAELAKLLEKARES